MSDIINSTIFALSHVDLVLVDAKGERHEVINECVIDRCLTRTEIYNLIVSEETDDYNASRIRLTETINSRPMLYDENYIIRKDGIRITNKGCAGNIKFIKVRDKRDCLNQAGMQYSLICISDAHLQERFTIEYLKTRVRGTEGKSNMLLTFNSEDVYLAGWLDGMANWYYDLNGNPIPARSGVVRYYVTINGRYISSGCEDKLKAVFDDMQYSICTYTVITC